MPAEPFHSQGDPVFSDPITVMKSEKFRGSARPRVRVWSAAAVSVATLASLPAAEPKSEPGTGDFADVTTMSLEQLGSIKVTSVSKKSERLDRVPAAVSVITGDDIRHSGALTLPEVLRMAPCGRPWSRLWSANTWPRRIVNLSRLSFRRSPQKSAPASMARRPRSS